MCVHKSSFLFYPVQFGSEIVRVSVSETGRFDGPENGSLWGLDSKKDVLVRPPVTSMLLHDFFLLADRSKEIVKEVFYLEYLALSQYLGQVSVLEKRKEKTREKRGEKRREEKKRKKKGREEKNRKENRTEQNRTE